MLRDGGAVDRHEGLVLRGLRVVEGARHQLLAGAALAGDEHARGGGAHARDHREDLLHRLRLADEVVEARLAIHLLLEAGQLRAQAALAERPLHGEEQLLDLEGLGDVLVGAEPHRADGVSIEPKAVIMMTCGDPEAALISRSMSSPSRSGMRTSEITRSSPPWRARSIPARPPGAASTR